MTNRKGKIEVFDGLRGVAVFMVFMVHAQNGINGFYKGKTDLSTFDLYFKKFFAYFPVLGSVGGHLGVDLFFILSGFLIYRTLTKKDTPFFSFMWNRMRRLLPAHVVVLLKSLGYVSFFDAIINILMLTDLFISVKAMNFVTWTLTYEILFYTLCAIWIAFARKNKFLRGWGFQTLLMLLIIISQYTVIDSFEKIGISPPNIRFLTFFYGIILSRIYYEHKNVWKKIKPYLSRIVIPSLVIIWLLKMEWGMRNYPVKIDFFRIQMEHIFILVGIAFFLLVAGLLATEKGKIKRIFTYKPLRALGNISYSFYLVHAMVTLPMATKLLTPLPLGASLKAVLYAPVGFIITVLVASFVFHFLEKPYFMKRGNKQTGF